LLNPEESNLKKAKSLAFGVFMGIVPIWGFQMIAAFSLAIVLKLNKTLVLIASNISIPPLIPMIVFVSIWLGGFVLHTGYTITFSATLSLQSIHNMMIQYIIGSIVLAALAGVIVFLVSYIILSRILRNDK
jgi:uncharacterized protein (DUF2062 family)